MRPQLVRAVLLAHEQQHHTNVTFWRECGSMLGGSLIRTAQVARRLSTPAPPHPRHPGTPAPHGPRHPMDPGRRRRTRPRSAGSSARRSCNTSATRRRLPPRSCAPAWSHAPSWQRQRPQSWQRQGRPPMAGRPCARARRPSGLQSRTRAALAPPQVRLQASYCPRHCPRGAAQNDADRTAFGLAGTASSSTGSART